MSMNPLLSLSEKLVLLATDIQKGNLVCNAGISLNYCIAGTVLFEMMESGLIKMEGERVINWPRDLTGNAVYDLGLMKVKHLEKEKTLKYWIEMFSSVADHMRTMLLEQLVKKGVLEKREKTFLWVFHLHRFPEKDAEPENHIRARLIAIVEGQLDPDQEDLVLLSIVKSSDLVWVVFPTKMRKQAKKRIEELTHEDRFTGEIAAMIQDIQTAIITVMVASVAVIAVT